MVARERCLPDRGSEMEARGSEFGLALGGIGAAAAKRVALAHTQHPGTQGESVRLPMARGDFTRWMYRGRRPNLLARFMNRVAAVLGSSGVASNRMVALEVVGRKSGRIITLPLVPAKVAGQRYLVSMLGEDVEWVRNVRAAGGLAVLRHSGREQVRLDDVPPAQRAPVLKDYLRRAPGARPHIPVDKDAPLSEFEKIAASFPVFRVVAV